MDPHGLTQWERAALRQIEAQALADDPEFAARLAGQKTTWSLPPLRNWSPLTVAILGAVLLSIGMYLAVGSAVLLGLGLLLAAAARHGRTGSVLRLERQRGKAAGS